MFLTAVTPQPMPLPERLLATPFDLQCEVQGALRALADVEQRYEAARERLEQRSIPETAKHAALAELEAEYQQERRPYLHRLDQLQQRIRRVALSGL
jgi:hypothetical protein